ncbi:WXG100 family type VII secretion target [Paenibacillus tundrae]|uniref:WXG100 family type VII secretion target n=1 Tax=Paenibacillus tundrae TaxID=528187 RepID=A0ABT9WHL1_9BACL|nr:WXG100 family type VII secretion target [Paenibacillus tundrae]MDQ0172707.1 WXG100 family type VII secretion target [Paenibacillus tundrae]
MNTIKVTPEQLHYVSNQMDQARQQLESIRGELIRQIMFIRMMWTGATQEQFYYDFERSSSTLDRALDRMVQTSKELKDIATRFENADAQNVSLGAAAGAVGAAAMVTNSSGTASDDKGYRMAQVNVYGKLMWLPVNENGVPDQASLQAYQKDKGHLDINQMQAVHVEPPGEDIYALQIEALELGINPFTGKSVSDNYAQLMIASLKVSQIFMGIQMVRGSIPGGKGKYRLPSNSKVVTDMKKNIEAAKAKRDQRKLESSSIISNKFPNEGYPKDGRVLTYHLESGRIKGINGRTNVDFVINKSGELIIGKRHHTLGGREDVLAAGQLTINGQGEVRKITNQSGHYRPSPEESSMYADLLRDAGVKVKSSWLELYKFDTDNDGYVTDSKPVIIKKLKE